MAVTATTEEIVQAADRAAARRAAGYARIELALQHIEEAQREIGRAQQELFSVVGLAADNDRLRKLYDKTKAEWYRLRKKVDQLRGRPHRSMGLLDHDTTPADRVPHKQGCGQVGWSPR